MSVEEAVDPFDGGELEIVETAPGSLVVMDEATTDRAVQLHAQGLAPPKIAEELDTTDGIIRRALDRRDVPRRPVPANQRG